VNHVNMILGLI